MATSNLSGSLADFTVADVLVLLAMGGRTAQVRLAAGEARGCIDMVEGRVSAASADATRAVLLRSVVIALSVGVDDLGRAVQEDDPLGDLVDRGVVARAAAQQVATEQCMDAVADMLSWESGTFEVWVGGVARSDLGLRLDPGDLVASARSRSVEWQEVQAALPDADSVLSFVPEVSEAPALAASQWAVLARIDGRRTVDEVLAATGVSLLSAGHRLADLLGSGLVRVVAEGDRVNPEAIEQIIADVELAQAGATVVGAQAEGLAAVESTLVAEPDASAGLEPDMPEPLVAEAQAPSVFAEAFATPDPAGVAQADAAGQPATAPAPEFQPAMASGPELQLAMASTAEVPTAMGSAAEVAQAMDPAPDLAPMEFALDGQAASQPTPDPVAELDEAGAEFAWSPWAQEMGLGERVDAADSDLAEPPMSAAAPAPQLPTPAQGEAQEPPAAPAHAMAYAAVAVGSGAHGLVTSVEEDRVPGQAGPVDMPPSSNVATAGQPEPGMPEPRAAAGDAEDPLGDGLLGQLMSSVRGM